MSNEFLDQQNKQCDKQTADNDVTKHRDNSHTTHNKGVCDIARENDSSNQQNKCQHFYFTVLSHNKGCKYREQKEKD